jgi:hypothetical protein
MVSPRLSLCFTDGQQVRHRNKRAKNVWHGTYVSNTNSILCNDTHYTSLSAFATAHIRSGSNAERMSASGWAECEVLKDGKWIVASSLKEVSPHENICNAAKKCILDLNFVNKMCN